MQPLLTQPTFASKDEAQVFKLSLRPASLMMKACGDAEMYIQ